LGNIGLHAAFLAVFCGSAVVFDVPPCSSVNSVVNAFALAASTIGAVYLLYSALVAAVLVLGSPFWLVQMLRLGKYRAGLKERFGMVPRRVRTSRGPSIWVHAVSVGEVLAVSELVAELRRQLAGHRVVVSTTTLTGQRLARERFGEENVFYFPLDLATTIQPYFDVLRPELVVLAETEFWPNFLRLAKRNRAKVAVVNARISDRSLPRYTRFRGLLRPVLENVDLFLGQSEEDARRLIEIGAVPARVQVSGNLKFDVRPPQHMPVVAQLRAALERGSGGPVLIAGSSVEGEEIIILNAFRAVLARHSKAILLLAPRHKERFEAVADLMQGSGLKWWRRSSLDLANDALSGGVLLLDTIGELASLYELSEIALVCGSLVPRGGHNILEPALHGAAILVGPHTENFRDIMNLFGRAKALRKVTGETLAATWLDLIENDKMRGELGDRAQQVMREQMGATARTLEALREMLSSEVSG
jgi:3-deoxy-D-manno-octulosonic-acid transferase